MTVNEASDETLWMRWQRSAERDPDRESIVFLRAGESPQRRTRAEILTRARQYASWLAARGVREGETCALIVRHHPEFYPLYLGIVALGAIPAVLAHPNPRLHPAKFRSGLLGMAQRSGLHWILCEAALERTLRELIEVAQPCVQGLLLPLEAALGEEFSGSPRVSADGPCLLQHSSGTTGLQKAVVLSHRAVLRQVHDYGRALGMRSEDRIVSWLPLYHDMGLIAAFHLPLALGVPAVQLDPFEWVAAPILWVEAMSSERGTLSWLPNFAYSLMGARLHDDELAGLSLEHVRLLVNCSEPVRHASHKALLSKLGSLGLRSSCLGASYAMAETTFAVTQTTPGRESTVVRVPRTALSGGSALGDGDSAAFQRDCVSSGQPLADCAVRVIGPDGSELPDDHTGELVVRSPALFDGYRNNAEQTEQVLRDGWYWTGDIGFRHSGEIFVIGRKKDLIIVAGKNLYPEDIEDAVGETTGVLPGRCVAFGREDPSLGTERVCVIVESELPASEHAKLSARVVAAGQGIDVTISEVHVVTPRWLIKSSSGKLSRAVNRERIEALEGDNP